MFGRNGRRGLLAAVAVAVLLGLDGRSTGDTGNQCNTKKAVKIGCPIHQNDCNYVHENGYRCGYPVSSCSTCWSATGVWSNHFGCDKGETGRKSSCLQVFTATALGVMPLLEPCLEIQY